MLDALLSQLVLRILRSVGVETEQHLAIDKRILLLGHGTLRDARATPRTENGLNLGRIDQLGKIGLLNNGRRKQEVLLQLGRLGGGAVDLVERGKGGGSPDDKAAEVPTGCQLKEIEGIHGARLHAGDVPERQPHAFAVRHRIIHHQGSTALAEPPSTHLAFARSHLARLLHLVDIRAGTDNAEEGDGFSGLGNFEGGRGDDKRDFGDSGNVVAAGHEERGTGRGSEGRAHGEAPGGS